MFINQLADLIQQIAGLKKGNAELQHKLENADVEAAATKKLFNKRIDALSQQATSMRNFFKDELQGARDKIKNLEIHCCPVTEGGHLLPSSASSCETARPRLLALAQGSGSGCTVWKRESYDSLV